MKIIKITGMGSEIIKAIQQRSKQSAHEWNVKQAEKYLRYCKTTGDKTLITYAEKKLREII